MRGVLAEAIVGRHLLTHPFYRRWDAGQLSPGELGAYAEQYRHIERALPETLAAIADALPAGRARELVEANLADELGIPRTARRALRDVRRGGRGRARCPRHALDGHPAGAGAYDGGQRPAASALAMVAAYEAQAADIATSKSEGLRRHYGFDSESTRFWDVHSTQEVAHAAWSTVRPGRVGCRP